MRDSLSLSALLHALPDRTRQLERWTARAARGSSSGKKTGSGVGLSCFWLVWRIKTERKNDTFIPAADLHPQMFEMR
ncbi:hypothetical protein CRENBAI_024547 [Crenichthys baileyi]|uniref:Uncharacterized protein n=1 Tax=Crenichthys baileyi TaxID=28760 RepID=A0AAV9RCF5_9TELE